jgi:hypothetical protein
MICGLSVAHIEAHALSIGTIDPREKKCLLKDLFKLEETVKCAGQFNPSNHELKQLLETLLHCLLSNDRVLGYAAYETINCLVCTVTADPFELLHLILNIPVKHILAPAEIYRLQLLNDLIRFFNPDTVAEFIQDNEFYPLLHAGISAYHVHEDSVFLVNVMDVMRTLAKLLGQNYLHKNKRVKFFRSMLNKDIIQKVTSPAHLTTHYLQSQAMKLLMEIHRAFCAIQDKKESDKGDSQECLAHLEITWYRILIGFLLTTAEDALKVIEKARESHHFSISFANHDGECPFIQEWMLLVGMALLSYFEFKIFQRLPIEKFMGSENSLDIMHSLLPTSQILEFISEEDDILTDFLHILLNIYILEETHHNVSTVSRDCSTYIITEFQPDLVFIKFIKIIGQDPVVCIDFLTSSGWFTIEYYCNCTN